VHDGARNAVLLSPFLVTLGLVWLAWALYGGRDFQTIPTKELAQLLAQARITGPEAAPAAVWEYTARLAWNAVAGVYLVFLLATVLIGIWIVSRLFASTPRCGLTSTRSWPIVLLVAFSLASWYVLRAVTYGAISGSLLGPTVFTQAPDLPARQQFFSQGGQITALFLAALSALVLPSSRCGREACLRDRTALLELVLGMGTALLVTDVIREDTLLRWALAFVDPANKTVASTVQNLTVTIVAVRGVQGTALLAAIYLPAALILKGQAWSAVPASVATLPEAKQWLQDRGLIASSVLAQFRPVVAVLLPLLTGVLSGPAAEVLKNLTRS